MKTEFEDAFTDLQSESVSLCLEFLENANVMAKKIYIYMYQTKHERMFNAFFDINDAIISAGGIGTEEQSDEFLNVGTDDIARFIELCDKYQRPCPNEWKLVFEVETKKFDAQYRYEEYSEQDETSPVEVLMHWFAEEKQNKNIS